MDLALARTVANLRHGLGLEELKLLVGAAGNFQQIDARIVEPLHDLDTFVQREAALHKVRRIQLDGNWIPEPDTLSDRADDLQQQAGPVVQRTTPAVVPLVGARRQKLR